MTEQIQTADPIAAAQQAERDLNSHEAKSGERKGAGDSTTESGIDDSAAAKFPGGTATYGSAASGAGDNREIPDEEGGGLNPTTGRQTVAGDFEGVGGPEEKLAEAQVTRGGDDDVTGNVRQGKETIRP